MAAAMASLCTGLAGATAAAAPLSSGKGNMAGDSGSFSRTRKVSGQELVGFAGEQKFSKHRRQEPMRAYSDLEEEASMQEFLNADTDVSFVGNEYGTGGALSWLDENYLSLKMQSHRIVENEARNALQHHFKSRQRTKIMHQLCVRSASLTFVCGDDKSVVSAVAPASVSLPGRYIGTSHMV